MNKFTRKFLSPAILGVAVAGMMLVGGNMLGGGSMISAAHANNFSVCSVSGALADSVSDANPQVGETITYTLTGGFAVTAPTTITVDDALGAGLTFVSANATIGTYSSSTGVWNVGSVSTAVSGETLTITAKVDAGTVGQTIQNNPLIHYVQSSCTQSQAVTGASITVQAAPTPVADIMIAKTANVTSTIEGGTIDYTITVSAQGPATSTGVTATDKLPSGLTFDSATTSEGSYASSTGIWTIGDMSPSTVATLNIEATANAGTAGTTITNTAIVGESTSTINNNPNTSSSVPVYVASSTPVATSTDFSITKTVDDSAPATGNTVHYTVTVTDLGPAASTTGVVATDTLPSGLTFVSATTSEGSYASSTGTWTIGTMTPSSSATLDIAALVNASDTVGMTIANTATVANESSTATLTVSNGGGTPTSTPTSTIANLGIVKTVDNATPTPGATIHYTLTVNAQGPATSTGVVATDTLPSGLTFENATTSVGSYASSTGTWTIGDMTPSSTATLDIAALVNASDTVGMTIANIGLVGESTSTINNNPNTSSTVTVTVTSPGCTSNCGGGGGTDADIAITKTADVTSTLPGGTIHYTITATANGPQASTNVVATDTLPSELTFVSATPSVGTYSSSTGTWTIGTLAANATATLAITATVNASGTANTTITNQATIGESPTLTDTNPGNNMSQVAVTVGNNGGGAGTVSDLAIVKTVDNANPLTGSDVNFTIVVTNNGPTIATFVEANDDLPVGLALVSASTTQGSTTNAGVGAIEWTIGTLAPNATATMTMEAEVSAAAGATITNTATVSSTLASFVDPNPANNSSSVTLNVQSAVCTSNCGGGGGGGGNTPSAQIGIVKTVDNSTPTPGATIHYTLTVTASGPNPSFGVVASDTLPAGVTFVSASSSQGSYSGATGIWTIGTMVNGASSTLTITATVNSSDAIGEKITNTGTVSESPTVISPLTGPMTSSVTITVGGNGGGGNGGGGGGGNSTSTGQVLGASCGLYLTSYIHPVRKYLNDPAQVKKLQTFLNQNLGLALAIDGNYSAADIAAVDQFQVKYHIEVLAPWVPLGLPTEYTPTGYVYQTTQRWINLIMCPPLNLPLPQLKVDTGA